MNIQDLYPVIWKELKERRYRNKTMLACGIFMVAFLAMSLILQSKQTLSTTFLGGTQNLAVSFVVYAQLFTMFVIGWIAINYAFYDERAEKTLEPLLCTPLTITIVWLGKVIAVWLVAFLYSIVAIIILTIILRLFLSLTVSLSVPILLRIFIVSPLLVSTVLGLIGFLLFTTKNILLAKFIVMFLGILLMNFLIIFRETLSKLLAAPWKLIGLSLLISLGLMVIIAYSTRFLRKEKVI